MPDNQFKLQINFTKTYVDENGNHCLEGVASGPEVDLTDERMSPDALKSMVISIKKRLIEFRDAHKQEWNDDLGEVVELSLDESNHLIYRSVLDMNLSGSKDLWYRVHTLGKKYGVSIGGAVLKAGMEYVAEIGRQVYTYFDVDLYEISITRQAAYQYSFANAVLKSLPKGHSMPEDATKAEVTKTDAEETTTEAQTEETAQEEAVAAEEQSDATETEGQEVVTEEATEEAAAEVDAEADATEESTEAEAETTDKAAIAAESEEVAAEPDAEVSKALTAAQEEVATLTRSLTDTQAQVAELTKSLEAKTTEVESAQTELVEVKKTLAEKESELEKRDARKAIVFDKFGGTSKDEPNTKEITQAAQTKFAGFIVGGPR